MKTARLGLLPLAFLLLSGASATDPLRDRLIADARAVTPAALNFDRNTSLVRKGGGTRTDISLVERWDGKGWTLISQNGRPPTRAQKRDAERLAAAVPVPGYHRLANLLATATEARADAQGRTVLTIPVLPENSVRTDTGDISSHLKAEAVVGSRDGKPFVERVHVSARETFKLNALIKVKSFDMVSTYAIDGDGRPRLASQSANSVGSLFGIPGGESSQVTFTYR
jgi:hypothetical protein